MPWYQEFWRHPNAHVSQQCVHVLVLYPYWNIVVSVSGDMRVCMRIYRHFDCVCVYHICDQHAFVTAHNALIYDSMRVCAYALHTQILYFSILFFINYRISIELNSVL